VGELSTTINDAAIRALAQDAAAVRGLREFNEKQIARDPAAAGWPQSLLIELALKTAAPVELKEHYGYDDDSWFALRDNPQFVTELSAMVELVKQEGMSIKLKARLQSEELLTTQWKLIHGPTSEVPAAVKAKMIETTFRIAGLDTKGDGNNPGNQLNIQINL
jgi:hypothetical protein